MGMATGAGSEQGCVPGFEVWWEPTSGGSREPGRSVAQLQLEAVRRSAGCWALSHRGPWETLRREDLPYRDISGRGGVGVFEPGCWQGVLFPLGCGFGGLPGVARRRRGNCSGILRRGFGKGLAWGPRQWHWHQLCASVAAVAAPCRDCAPQDRISQDLIHREVQDYYGRELQKSEDLKTNACVTLTRPVPKAVRDALQRVHEEVVARYYGCGLIIPECLESCRVLDLGSGSGRDCYVLSQLVGEQGHVTGIDMTEAQVEVAKKHIAYHMEKFGYQKPNVEFLQGYVENLGDVGLADESYDIVISNCVINLTPDKRAVLREAYRVLKPGGEMYFSDVYANQHLSEAMRKHRVLWGECLAGALFWRDLYSIAKEVGFSPPCLVTASPITVSNEELERIIGDCRFVSATFRLFKVPGSSRAAPGQVIYNGGIAGHEQELEFDASFTFKVGEVVDVDAEMAAILQSSRFAEKFLIRAGGTDGAAPQGCCHGKMKEKICDPFLLLQQRAAPAPACGAAGTCGPQGCC